MTDYPKPEELLGDIAAHADREPAHPPPAVPCEKQHMEHYISSRMIVDPFCLRDCDYPVDGSVAPIIATAVRASSLRQRPGFHAMEYGIGRGADSEFGADFRDDGAFDRTARPCQRCAA